MIANYVTGSDPPSRPNTRFDVIRWEYFTETHIFLDSDSNTIKELQGKQACLSY